MITLQAIVNKWIRGNRVLDRHFLIERRQAPAPILARCINFTTSKDFMVRKIPGWINASDVLIYHPIPSEASASGLDMLDMVVIQAADPDFFDKVYSELILWHNIVIHPAKCPNLDI